MNKKTKDHWIFQRLTKGAEKFGFRTGSYFLNPFGYLTGFKEVSIVLLKRLLLAVSS